MVSVMVRERVRDGVRWSQLILREAIIARHGSSPPEHVSPSACLTLGILCGGMPSTEWHSIYLFIYIFLMYSDLLIHLYIIAVIMPRPQGRGH